MAIIFNLLFPISRLLTWHLKSSQQLLPGNRFLFPHTNLYEPGWLRKSSLCGSPKACVQHCGANSIYTEPVPFCLFPWIISLMVASVGFLWVESSNISPLIKAIIRICKEQINYQALLKAGRGGLEAVREIVWGSLQRTEWKVHVGLWRKVGLEDLVEVVWDFFIRNTTGKFLGWKMIGRGRRNWFRL